MAAPLEVPSADRAKEQPPTDLEGGLALWTAEHVHQHLCPLVDEKCIDGAMVLTLLKDAKAHDEIAVWSLWILFECTHVGLEQRIIPLL